MTFTYQGIVSRLGGIAFKPVVFFSVALILGFCQLMGYDDKLGEVVVESHPLAFGFLRGWTLLSVYYNFTVGVTC